MSQELAARNNLNTDWITCLDEILPLIETVVPRDGGFQPAFIEESVEKLRNSFDKDYERLVELDDLLFGEDIIAYGERCATVFSRWEEEGGGPSLLALIVRAWEHFGASDDEALIRAGIISAILAEIPNELQFHGNEHYRKVLFHVIRMIKTHNFLHEDDEWTLDREESCLLMIAGTIHDLGHEGGDNMRDGIYTPGYMEQKAVDLAMPYFEAVGMSTEHQAILQTLVFCTDITFFAGDNSPCVRMRKIYNYYFVDQSDDAVLDYMMGKLRPFENQKVSLIAMILHEADIGTSAGLNYERSIIETINIMEERFIKNAGPKVLLAFLKEQLEGSMKTESGVALFGPGMDIITEEAVQDFQNGRETYYD